MVWVQKVCIRYGKCVYYQPAGNIWGKLELDVWDGTERVYHQKANAYHTKKKYTKT